jgi:acetyl esterase/lipase
MTLLFFLLSLASALFTYNVRQPVSRPPLLRVFGFFAGWVWGELAPWIVAIHVVLIIGFGVAGAITGGLGIIGLILMAGSCAVLVKSFLDSGRAALIVDRALTDGLGNDFDERIRAEARSKFDHGVRWNEIALPFKTTHPDVECIQGIQFAREKGCDLKLDVLRHRSTPQNAPVLLQIHGGGWSVGYKENQAQPLMARMASKGWVCVNVDYRLSPAATLPEHLIDCKRSIAWIRENIERYGGDPNFIIATGGSAGGHLSAMVGLTANAAEYQPGFETVDTSVQACIPFYGIYDLADRHGFHTATDMPTFLEQYVMKGSYDELPELYHASSPLDRIHEDAPPFFIIHGALDMLAAVDDARVFCEALRTKSKQPVMYAEFPEGQHAFDVFHCLRSQASVDGVERFAEYVYSDYLDKGATKKKSPVKKPAAKAKAATKAAPKAKKPASKKPPVKKAASSAGAKALNGSASTGLDVDSRVAHLPASKAEAAKPKALKTASTKRKSASKPAASKTAKRKPTKKK